MKIDKIQKELVMTQDYVNELKATVHAQKVEIDFYRKNNIEVQSLQQELMGQNQQNLEITERVQDLLRDKEQLQREIRILQE